MAKQKVKVTYLAHYDNDSWLFEKTSPMVEQDFCTTVDTIMRNGVYVSTVYAEDEEREYTTYIPPHRICSIELIEDEEDNG